MINKNSIPEKWCVEGPINDIGFGKFDNSKGYWSGNGITMYYYLTQFNKIDAVYGIPEGYTKITKEQYKELINSQTNKYFIY